MVYQLPPPRTRANKWLIFDGNGYPTVGGPPTSQLVPSTTGRVDPVVSVINITALRALTFYPPLLAVRGYNFAGDGGGGSFYWDAQSTAADDGVRIIRPNALLGSSPGRWTRLTNGIITPAMGGALPNSGIVNDAFERALNAAAGMTFEIGGGLYDCDRTINGPGSVTVRVLAGSEVTWRNAPPGTVSVLFQGPELEAPRYLSADAHLLGPAPPWDTETPYAIDDRCSQSSIDWRALEPHTSNALAGYVTRDAAFRADEVEGKWEPTNLQTAADVSDLMPGDWLFVQDSKPFESLAGGSVEGEAIQIAGVDALGRIISRNRLHYDYLVAKGAFFRKVTTLNDIIVEGGGKITGRFDLDTNSNIGLFFNRVGNLTVRNVEFAGFATDVSYRDVLRANVHGNRFLNGFGLAYGNAISDGCVAIDIHDNYGENIRHFATASSEPGRAGPRMITYAQNRLHVSRRFLPPTAASPYGGGGDGFDTHQSCDGVTMRANVCIDASGAAYHCECRTYWVIDNEADGCNIGASCGNNTVGLGQAIVTGNRFRRCSTHGIDVRVGGGTSASYSRVDVSGNDVENVGSLCYLVTGVPGKRIANFTFRDNHGADSKSGAYMALLEYVDNPNIQGNDFYVTGLTQQALAVFNTNLGVTAGNTITGAPGYAATALFFSDVTNLGVARLANVGDATMVVPADTVIPPGALAGTYRFTCGDATTQRWDVIDPNAVALGTATTGVPFDFGNNIKGTIVAGTIVSAVNDIIDYTARLASTGMTITANALFSPNRGVNRGIFFGNTVNDFYVDKSNKLSQAATPITVDNGPGHIIDVKRRTVIVTTNGNTTWTNTTSAKVRRHVGPLTADRNVTLAMLNATDGNGPVVINDDPTFTLHIIDEFRGTEFATVPPGARAEFAFYESLRQYGRA